MPPKTPRKNPPVAIINLTSQNGRSVVLSTLGTTAGTTGQGRFKTPSQLASWKIYYGDQQQEAGVGTPPASFSHTYAASVGATAYILFTVVDVNTLSAQASLTIEGMGQVPSAPTNLNASPLGPTAVMLDWTDAVGNAQTYTIEAAPQGSGNYVVIGTVSAPTTTFTVSGLTPNTAYDFRVFATNNLGSSGYSNVASATTDPAFPVPSEPTNLNATAISTTRIDLAWTDNTGGTASVEIQRKITNDQVFATIASVAVGITSFSDTGLTPATSYTYRVRAISIGGVSPYSNEDSATTQTAAPAAPTNVTATPLSSSSIQVSWIASTGATSYTVERSLHGAGVWSTVATPSSPPITDTGLSPSTSYDYRVKATNAGGDSAFSSIASATTFAVTPPPTPPAAPSNLAATPVSTSQIDLTWTDNSGNETNFEIQRKLAGGTYATIATVAAGVTAYSSTGLTQATAYVFRVRATNAVGASAFSNEASATTNTAPPVAPTNLTATPTSTSTVDIAWTGSTGAIDYVLERSPHNAGTFSVIATITAPNFLTFTDTGLAASTSYDYRVKARNTGGSSPYSALASATTFTPVPPPTPPSAPSGLTATTFSQSQINLAWTDNSSNETNFQIERKLTTGGTFALIATVAAGVVAYSDAGLAASTSYTYRVRATNAGGNSSYSNEATAVTSATPPPPVPNAPSNLTASNPTQTSLQIAWTDNSTDETGFTLERAVGNGTFAVIQTLAPNITNYLDNVLTAETTYRYRIRAFNANGNSAYSNIATGTTLAAPPPVPNPPSGLTATQSGNQQVTLQWTDNSGNEIGFQIERRVSGGVFGVIAQVVTNVVTYIDTSVVTATYEYRVSAFNNAGSSAPSNTASVNVVVTGGGGNQVLAASDFTYIGCVRIPDGWGLSAQGGMTGRTVGGRDRIFLYGIGRYFKMNAVVSAATSPSSFRIGTVSSGPGGVPSVGQRINVVAVTGLVFPQNTAIQTITPNGADYDITVSPALSATPAVGSYVWADQDPIIEVEIPTSGITQQYQTTTQATLIAAYVDPYRGKRVSWRAGQIQAIGGTPNDPGYRFPGGLYYQESTGLLFWTSFDPYGGAGGVDQHDWELGASQLGAPSTVGGTDGSATSYGPWRMLCTDGDGTTFYGAWRFGYLTRKPDGSFLGGGLVHSGATLVPYGPSLYGGAFPTTSTPGGPTAPNITVPDRYLNYYFPNPGAGTNYYNPDGSLVGVIRQFQHADPPGYSIIFEQNYFPIRSSINPAFNGGIATWNGATEGCLGAIWLTGPNKNNVLFAASLTTGPNLTPSDATGPHTWYQSNGQYTIDVSTVAGFVPFEVVLGLTSGVQISAETITAAGAGGFPAKISGAVTFGQDFQVGETVQGQTSGATAIVAHTNRHNVCYHNHPGTAGITGDVALRAFPAIIIYEGSRLETNKSGSTVDYTTIPGRVIDLEATYGLQSAPVQNVGSAKQVWGFFYNPTTRRLYITAPQADLSLGQNNPQTLIHIFEIRAGAL